MKLHDKCWRLNWTQGISETTVSECTRGDSLCDEFFVTEAEAWDAEAARAARDSGRAYNEYQRHDERAADARANAAKCRSQEPKP